MFGWVRRLMGGGREAHRASEVEPLIFKPSVRSAPRPASARAAPAPQPSAKILDRYVYGTTRGGEDRTARRVEYLGIVERPSDGFTCLTVRMPGSTRRHMTEVALVVEMEIAGRVHRPTPMHERYAVTADKLRAFIEG